MTDEDKALVERLRSNRPLPTLPHEAADRIEAQAAEIEKLRRDHASVVNETNITKARLKGVTKLWHADRAEIEKLREALKEVFEAWAGSEGFIPETAPEGYLLYLTKRMGHIARAALGETK